MHCYMQHFNVILSNVGNTLLTIKCITKFLKLFLTDEKCNFLY